MSTLAPVDEYDLYSTHEEDTVPEGPAHHDQAYYLEGVFRTRHPELWVTGNICLYWEQGNADDYVAPDVTVVSGPPPSPLPKVYLAWRERPLLFVAEVASPSTVRNDLRQKLAVYERDLRVPEYLFTDPPRQDVRLWRLVEGRYLPVAPDANGRVWSEGLGVGFGFEEDELLWAYTPAGQRVLGHADEYRRAEAEARRADAEARRAETERRRAETEKRRAESERQRAEAEAAKRSDLEERLAAMAAEIERLRGQQSDAG